MNYDREEDILYLAYQLWEESDVPKMTARTYWKQAALQVLAQGRSPQRKLDAITESGHGKTDLSRFCSGQVFMLSGLSLENHGVFQPKAECRRRGLQ